MKTVVTGGTGFIGSNLVSGLLAHGREVIVATVLLIAMVMGMFNVHSSPFIKMANDQVTYRDVSGMDWFLRYQNGKNLIDQIGVYQYTLSALVIGNQATPTNIRWGTGAYQPPDHFGYDSNQTYGQSYSEDRYFLSRKVSRIYLPLIFPEYELYWRWNNSDWEKLENDPSVLRIYHNGEFEVFYIRSQ